MSEYSLWLRNKKRPNVSQWHFFSPTPGQKRLSATPTPTNISHSSPAPCHYEGKYFTLGESWLRKDCFHCTCLHPVGVGCCDT